jgi:hypothetical protein
MKQFIFLIVLICCAPLTFAQKNPELLKQFKSDFIQNYVENQCGANILGLLRRAESKGINLHNSHILEISNKGFSLFGLINAEFARAAGRINPNVGVDGIRNLPGENNWYHHVVLEMDGEIYDFDFGNAPVVLPVKVYFEKMFLDDKKSSEGGERYIGRDEKLKTYEILVRPGLETIRARSQNQQSPIKETLRLQYYLRDFP